MKKFCKKCNCETERKAQGQCKPCVKLRMAQWYKKDQEKRKLSCKIWRESNPEKMKLSKENWVRNNPDKVRERSRMWYEKNKEYKSQYDRAYRKNNPEKVKLAMQRWSATPHGKSVLRQLERNRRAAKALADGSHTVKDVNDILKLQKYRCACCGISIKEKYHIDHIHPISKGGSDSKENLQMLCPTCNISKGAKHPIAFMQSRGKLL